MACCSVTFELYRKKRRVRLCENSMLRKIFGLEREEGEGGEKKAHTGELHNLYCSPVLFRVIK
jgi:hypothetical protein